MATTDPVKPETVQKFWNAYRACVEAHHIPPQRSGYYVRWVQEFVDCQPVINPLKWPGSPSTVEPRVC